MIRLLITVVFFHISILVFSQECSELLSLAEQDYRNGQFENAKSKLSGCFGIYATGKTGDIRPKYFRSMIEEMKKADTLYAAQLGIFREYWKDFIIPESQFNSQKKTYFSYAERNRAYILLGKIYYQLGVLPLSEFFSIKSIMTDPGNTFNDDNIAFNRIYHNQLKKVGEFSVGPLIGWQYNIPLGATNNRNGVYDFKYQTDGKLVLGGQFNYNIRPFLILNMNFWFNSSEVVYTEGSGSGNNEFDFYHSEKQNWIKIPFLLKWSSGKHFNWLKNTELWRTKFFIAPGFSLNYLTKSQATIIDLVQHTALYDYDVSEYRNRFNYEVMLQILCRFKLARNYLNIGLMGSYTIKDVLNQKLIGSGQNTLYTKYGIIENNYKLLSNTVLVTYEFRSSYLKK